MIKVALDVLVLEDPIGATGNRALIFNLVREIVHRFPTVRLTLVGGLRSLELFRAYPPSQVDRLVVPLVRGSGLARVLAQQTLLPYILRGKSFDVFHGPAHVLPLAAPADLPMVLTITDFRYLHDRGAFSHSQRMFRHLVYQRSMRRAHRILPISLFTKREAIERMRIDPEKFVVCPLGVSDQFRPRRGDELIRLNGLALRPGYLLTSGFLRHKRADLVIQALAVLRKRRLPIPRVVVLGVEKKTSYLGELSDSMGVSDVVDFVGYVPDESLPALYAGASVFIFPSDYEGFGLPILEAMASGVPVVASTRASIPEVAGPAALLVSDTQPAQLADAIWRVLHEPALRDSLIAAGLQRASEFTWRRTAERTVETYRAALGPRP